MLESSYIVLSRSAYKKNYNYITKILGPNIRFSSVIKGNAYGHGIDKFVPIAEWAGVRHFAAFSADEAYLVKQASTKKSGIMIMGYLSDDQLEWAIENEIEYYVFDLNRLKISIMTAQKIGKKAKIHIEVETGFHRTGFERSEFDEVIRLLKSGADDLDFEGLCTHYAGAESISNHVRVKQQYETYMEIYSRFLESGVRPKYRHTAGSAASLTYPETIMDMVRVGIAQYGFWPSPETLIHRFKKYDAKDSDLKRLLSWKTKVMEVKEIDVGEFVGYGTSYMAYEKKKIAIIPVGYSNGFSRSLSNSGRVLIHGVYVLVVGVVTMNTTTVDITHVPNVVPGDEVVLIGKQKRQEISIASFCEMSNMLNYQLLARLPQSIPRFITP
ncbi:MAG: alanine racemase [Salinivirgaceae bacterium]|nr:alanine racemase [Salinivirgaceae bacterium]